MDHGGIEIERRYLLSGAPSEAELAALGAQAARIEQVYLRGSDGWIRRARRIEVQGAARYVLTRKRDREGIARDEIESDISLDEYGRLVAEADPDRRVIRKVRHTFRHERWTLELDVFSEPPGLVLLEIELDDPADVPRLPASIQALVVREVSTEPAFTNHALALRPGAAAGPRTGTPATPARP